MKAGARYTIADFHAAALGSGVMVEKEVKVVLLLKAVGKYLVSQTVLMHDRVLTSNDNNSNHNVLVHIAFNNTKP